MARPKKGKTIKSSLKIGARWFHAEGKTVQEAVDNLKPSISKGVGVLVLECGEISKERILSGSVIQKLFGRSSRLSKEIAAKQIAILYQGVFA